MEVPHRADSDLTRERRIVHDCGGGTGVEHQPRRQEQRFKGVGEQHDLLIKALEIHLVYSERVDHQALSTLEERR